MVYYPHIKTNTRHVHALSGQAAPASVTFRFQECTSKHRMYVDQKSLWTLLCCQGVAKEMSDLNHPKTFELQQKAGFQGRNPPPLDLFSCTYLPQSGDHIRAFIFHVCSLEFGLKASMQSRPGHKEMVGFHPPQSTHKYGFGVAYRNRRPVQSHLSSSFWC